MRLKFNKKKPASKPEPVVQDARDEQVAESLSAIFSDESGQLPDMTKLERRRSRFFVYLLSGTAAFLLLLLVSVWAGFMVFKPFRGYSGKGLVLNIDGPSRVSLGQETSYFINWSNEASEPLAATEIRVSFPTDFNPTRIEPEPTGTGLAWRLGSVEFGGRGTITVKGVFSGALGTKTAIQAVGTYRPATFNSDFEALVTKQIEYSESVLDGSIEVPEKALPGDRISIAYVVHNRGSETMSGLEARLTLPPGFIREATGTADGLEGGWLSLPLGEIKPGASSTAAVFGTFASGAGGNLPIQAEAGRIGQGGVFQTAQRAEGVISVLAGDLSLKLVVNGSDADRTIAFGETLRGTLAYENTSGETLGNVLIRLRLEPLESTATSSGAVLPKKPSDTPKFVVWSELDDSSSGTVSGNALTWDPDSVSVLAKLTQGQEGVFEFSVPVIGPALAASGTTGFQAVVEATVETVGKSKLNRTVRTKPMVFKFRSDVSLAAQARYFSEEGAPQGSGPLPPVVGQPTTYRISWDLVKTLHELKNLRLTAILPKNVVWSDGIEVSAGEISYSEATREIRWQLNKLPADVGSAYAYFDLTLTPSSLDDGRFAQVMGETRFEATDADINETIILTKPALTTDLQNDEGAKGKGVVRKP
jgi:hypothetical protein